AGRQGLRGTEPATSSITGSATVTVTPAAASTLVLSGYPSPTTAGASNSFTVTARDAYGNVATGYTGKVHFTSSDAQAALPADYTYTATDAGVHSFNATLKTAGNDGITGTDTASSSTTGTAPVPARPAASTTLSLPASRPRRPAGPPNSFTVTARAAYGTVAPGYPGKAHFPSSDAQAVLPADYTYTTADAGVPSFNAPLKTAG